MSDAPVRHEERPHPGSRTVYTLTKEGVGIEEFTSGVKTHEDTVFYDEIWDSCLGCVLPRRALAVVALLSAAWAALPALLPAAWPVWTFAAGLLVAAWAFVLLRVRVLVVRLFNYDGDELASLRGLPSQEFHAFLEAMEAGLSSGRYPLQSLFEGLDLGRVEWDGLSGSWRCRFVYDRIVIDRSLFGWDQRRYYSLMALEPPVRLSWRLPGIPFAAGVLALVAAALCGLDAAGGHASALWPWAEGLGVAGILAELGALATLGIAVTVGAGGEKMRSPYRPWWQKAQRQDILRWLARLIRLADRLSEIDHEDYWEYHRKKLAILNEEGFLEPWPYRSALARLNSQEREEIED